VQAINNARPEVATPFDYRGATLLRFFSCHGGHYIIAAKRQQRDCDEVLPETIESLGRMLQTAGHLMRE
jgi:hypothetical protein